MTRARKPDDAGEIRKQSVAARGAEQQCAESSKWGAVSLCSRFTLLESYQTTFCLHMGTVTYVRGSKQDRHGMQLMRREDQQQPGPTCK